MQCWAVLPPAQLGSAEPHRASEQAQGGELSYQFLLHFPLLYSHKLEHLVLFSTSSAFSFVTFFFFFFYCRFILPSIPLPSGQFCSRGSEGPSPGDAVPHGSSSGHSGWAPRVPDVLMSPLPHLSSGAVIVSLYTKHGRTFASFEALGKLPCLQRAAFQSCWEIPGSVGLRVPSVHGTLWDSRATQRAVLL